jgi:hypothetical protein
MPPLNSTTDRVVTPAKNGLLFLGSAGSDVAGNRIAARYGKNSGYNFSASYGLC